MLNAQQETLKSSRQELQAALESLGAKFKGKECRCCFHKEEHASAGIFERDGFWFFKCLGCGVTHDIFSIRAFINKTTVGDELKKVGGNEFLKSTEKPPRVFKTLDELAAFIKSWEECERIEQVFKYTHPASGLVELAVVRWWNGKENRKKFTQATPTPGGYWMKGVMGQNPIYNRSRVAKADTVVVVEGEKCVQALHEVGIVATTSPAGAMNGDKADWSPLAGKTCILWPDADDPCDEWPEGKGVAHMKQVQKILGTLNPPARLAMVNVKELGLSDGEDAVDLIKRYRETYSTTEIKALVDDILADAEPVGIIGEFFRELDAMMAGERKTLMFPWRLLSVGARALMPGKVTCVCGDGGAGKTLFMSQCLVDWQQSTDIKACVYHLEDDRNYHMLRAFAQLAQESNLTRDEWCMEHAEWVKATRERFKNDLADIGARIFEAPDDQVSLEMLSDWVEARARDGFEVIVVDPVTAVAAGARPWIDDLKFITKCKVVCRRYGCRVVLVTHPRTGTKQGKGTHNDMAGGAAYPRFAHTVLWIERNDSEAEFSVYDGQMTQFMKPNRVLNISKARNGPAAGRRIAFEFDPKTLLYHEIGMVEKNPC